MRFWCTHVLVYAKDHDMLGRFYFAAAAVLGAISAGAAEFRVTALTPEYMLVQGDCSEDENAAFFADSRYKASKNPDWKIAQARLALHEDVRRRVREPLVAKMKAINGVVAYWPEANGMKHYAAPDGDHFSIKDGEVIHNVFVKVPPMKKGDKVDLGVAGAFVYDPEVPSPVFKVNQVGYAPGTRKYAYVGGWLGPAGPLPLAAFDGKPFSVVDAKSGKAVLSGSLALRMADPVSKEGVPFTGEETLEADLTQLDAEGRYYVAVEGIGRSMEFAVSRDALVEAWGHHMQGLFNKRCGIEKKLPYTQWPCPACHLDVIRGVQPPDQSHYDKDVVPADGKTVLSKDGKPFKFNHFNVITCSREMCATNEHLRIPGGYHDAADYDRRPMHLQIPRSLALDYLLKPGNFTDGQLCIPESGNGVPDILDEAMWGIKHLLAAQQPDGGVGTWIETTRHPGGEHAAPQHEGLQYYLSISTHNSCYDFAGTVALVARAFKAAGQTETAQSLLGQAIKAWNWAETHPPVVQAMRGCAHGKWETGPWIDLVYREPEGWSPRFMLTAALNLSALTGDMGYFDSMTNRIDDLRKEINKSSWGWSAYTFLEFALGDQCIPESLEGLKKEWIRRRVTTADTYLDELANAYPYRTPWYSAKHGYVSTMSWGNSHPLRRAESFVAAHAFTGDAKYLEGVHLANDFHNGCNPRGESLTSGMGVVYPARFLDLQSMDDGVAEYVGGITPYRWTYGVAADAKRFVYGERELARWPIWRRFANVESYSVAASEYTVWETILPPAAVLGYMLDGPRKVPQSVYSRKPAARLADLPGYWVKP